MKNGALIENVIWGIAAVLLLSAAARFCILHQSDPQLGLWDAGLVEPFSMPSQIALSEAQAKELYRDKPLVLIPTPAQAQAHRSCRDLFKYYGLDTFRFNAASGIGNPQGPCAQGRAISIPLDGDR